MTVGDRELDQRKQHLQNEPRDRVNQRQEGESERKGRQRPAKPREIERNVTFIENLEEHARPHTCALCTELMSISILQIKTWRPKEVK